MSNEISEVTEIHPFDHGREPAWNKLRRSDSLDIESGKLGGSTSGRHHRSKCTEWSVILHLAFQSIGVVYGDIGTSPLYTLPSTFTEGIKHEDDILGVLSLILYTLTFIPLLKYVFVVLRANDNGDGGTFALYSLICRHLKVGLIPSQEAEDKNVSTFKLELPNNRMKTASIIKTKLENSQLAKYFLLFATMLGTSMVIGDGIFCPCVSVLSAVGGIKELTSSMTEDTIMWVSVAILILLFMVQRFGTDKVGYSFAPIICVWFILIAGVGVYDFIKFDPTVAKAINPKYIVDYFKRNKEKAWISLGGVVMCITGTEALFADVGHFTVKSIQISMCFMMYPALVCQYMGQASYLRKHKDDVYDSFYKSIPGPLYWPMFVVAVLAATIASQAMISGTFSVIQQSLSLGCFPQVKVVHTSTKYKGQVYIPEVNYLLMLACVFVTIGFKNSLKITNAYGIAVVFVMILTSSFLVLIMTTIWKTHIVLVILYILVIGSIELAYLSSVLYKFEQGGYLPLVFAFFLMTVMYTWNYAYRKKYIFELEHKISPDKVKEIMEETNSNRLPGAAIFYSELVQGIPPIFKHYVANVPAVHSVLVFVSIKSLPISKVPVEERFLFRRVQPSDYHVYRCVVRYGYTEVRNKLENFEQLLMKGLKDFIIRDDYGLDDEERNKEHESDNDSINYNADDEEEEMTRKVEIVDKEEGNKNNINMGRDVKVLETAWRYRTVHFVGEHQVVAGKGANIGKRILIDYAYNFLEKNLTQTNKVFNIPHKRMLKVGMTYEL